MIVERGRVVVTARACAHRYGDRPPITGDEVTVPADRLPPRPGQYRPSMPGLDDWGYGNARSSGGSARGGFDTLGAADVWARVHLPLVDGVALTGQDRALMLAESSASACPCHCRWSNGFSRFRRPRPRPCCARRRGNGCTWHAAPTWLSDGVDLAQRRPVRPDGLHRRGRPATAYAEAPASRRRLLTA